MKKYPHGLTLTAVCAAIEDYQRHEDSVPEEGIIAAFNTLLGHSDIAEAFRALEQQRDALAAENAALKVISNDRLVFILNGVQLGYIKVPTVETDPALETIRIAVSPQEPTPATDAYLNSVRADAVASFAHQQRVIADATPEHGCQRGRRFAAGLAEDFAAQLRAGKDGE